MRDVYLNIEVVASALPTVDERIAFFEQINSYYSENTKINYNLGTWYGREKQDFPKAIQYLEKASKLSPADPDIFNNLGLVYGMTGDYNSALKSFLNAYTFRKDDKQIITNIGVTYQHLGDTTNAARYFSLLR
jgi:tetratricopeptide (TPR) repeat protein